MKKTRRRRRRGGLKVRIAIFAMGVTLLCVGAMRIVCGETMGGLFVYGLRRLFDLHLAAPIHGNMLPGGREVYGIDVSSYQKFIDWENLFIGIDAQGGTTTDTSAVVGYYSVDFAIIKATEGITHRDRFFHRNFEAAHKVGIPRGVYHYFKPRLSAIRQARHYIDEVALVSGDLPPVVDIEEGFMMQAQQLRDSLCVMLDILERHYGVPPIIYTSASFYYRFLNTPAFRRFPLWVAHYNVDRPSVPRFWHFWQFTDKGAVCGIDTEVDINCFVGSPKGFERILLP